MSYMQDPDKRHRGVGAIAAVDGASGKRARKQMMKNRAMAVIDARRARLAHGPGRALPVPLRGLGRISQEDGEGAGTPATGGGSGGGGTTIPTRTRATITPTTFQTTATSLPTVGPIVEPGPTTTPTTTAPPLTTTATPTAPTGGKTGYVPPAYTGGGGSGTFTTPGVSLPTFPAPSSIEELGPPTGGGGVSIQTIALVAGGIGLLYLLTRKSDE